MEAGPIIVATVAFAAIGLAAILLRPSTESITREPTRLSSDGIVCDADLYPCDPAGLAAGMEMELDHYALARVVASEAGSLPFIGQVAVAWVVRNNAAKVGRPIWKTIVKASIKVGGERVPGAGDGFFGRQGDPEGGYRYVASSKDTTEDHREIARAVCRGEIDDPTEGGVNFDSPQSYGVQAGTDEGDADTFADNRTAEGKISFALPGISINKLRVWRKA